MKNKTIQHVFAITMPIFLVAMLTGCSDEVTRKLALERVAQARLELKEVRALGVAVSDKEMYELTDKKFIEGKDNVDNEDYERAQKCWEEFEVLIGRIKTDLKDAKNTASNAEKKAQEKKDQLAAEQQALLDQQKRDAAAKLQAEMEARARAEAEAAKAKSELESEKQSKADLDAKAAADAKAKAEADAKAKAAAEASNSKPILVDVFTPDMANKTVIIKHAETLSKIARLVYNNSERWRDIYKLNKKVIKNPNVIQPGMKLVLPPK